MKLHPCHLRFFTTQISICLGWAYHPNYKGTKWCYVASVGRQGVCALHCNQCSIAAVRPGRGDLLLSKGVETGKLCLKAKT